jgi:DNA-binding CsgD family transcriptional regulator
MVDRQPPFPRLTPREREISGLIGLGFTNRQIGLKLAISERTVGAHVQNIFNKLDVSSRAEVASWSARAPAPPAVESSASVVAPANPRQEPPNAGHARALSRPQQAWIAAVVIAVALVIAATDDGGTAAARNAHLPAPRDPGTLIYQAELLGNGAGFGQRQVIGSLDASAVTFREGSVEMAVLRPGGNTGINVAMDPVSRYYADLTLSVVPRSNVSFWLALDAPAPSHPGQHLVAIDTFDGLVQLKYFVQQFDPVPLGPQIKVDGLDNGRSIRLSAFVDPPYYEVFVEGILVIAVRHTPGAVLQAPAFVIFGEDTGTVRITSLRIYAPS